MAEDRTRLPAIALLAASSAAAVAVLSLSALLVNAAVEGTWRPRRAVIITLPYALIWGIVGGGVAVNLCRRLRPQSGISRVWVGAALGAGVALISVAVLDTPSGSGLPEIVGIFLAGSMWGAVVWWTGWRLTGQMKESARRRS